MTNTTENRTYQSGNNKYKSKKKKNSPTKLFIVVIGLLAVSYYFLKPIIESGENEIADGPITLEEILYELPSEQREKDGITFFGSGQKILFSFITDRLDTISGKDFDEIAQNINLNITNYSGDYEYNYENGILYPCDNEIILKWGNDMPNDNPKFENLKFDFDGKSVSIGSGNIIDKVKVIPSDEFINFKKHEDSDCLTMVEIIEVTEPLAENDCHFYVFTNHPNNLRNDSILIADSTSLTYFDFGGKEYVEISITGKEGPFLKQNEFVFDTTLAVLNVWARTNKNNTPVFFSGNGKNIEQCKQVIEGCTNPKAPNYNPNATIENGTCEEEIFESEKDEDNGKSIEIPRNKPEGPKTFTCTNCGTKMEINKRLRGDENISISCKKDIIAGLVKQTIEDGNTSRLEDFWDYSNTKCYFNGSDVGSSWWGIFRSENLQLKSMSITNRGKIKELQIIN